MRTSWSHGSMLAALRRRGQRLDQGHEPVHGAVLDELERGLLEPDEAVLGRERRQHLGQQLPAQVALARLAEALREQQAEVEVVREDAEGALERLEPLGVPRETLVRAHQQPRSGVRLLERQAPLGHGGQGLPLLPAVRRSPRASSVCSARSVSPFSAQARPSRYSTPGVQPGCRWRPEHSSRTIVREPSASASAAKVSRRSRVAGVSSAASSPRRTEERKDRMVMGVLGEVSGKAERAPIFAQE